jgi:radical SAM superfamily enzyme YgiQ (UPF0313 family)
MRLVLINPRFPESFWSFRWALDNVLPGKRAVNPPLGLATLAALCPEDWQVEIVDENVRSVPLAPEADIVGVCGMGVQFPRQRELLAFYRSKGYYVVAGGSYASLCPEAYAGLADAVIAGEAEYIWPAFCRDLARGVPKPLYQETGTVALTDSPTPRFDLLPLEKYQAASLQFSRGCPFRCEFCDIIVMFGRKPRTKSLAQVGAELDRLWELGVTSAFFVDDNLIGDKPAAKRLLRFLRDYQRDHGRRFHFGTEASLNLAQDEELLALMREANFEWVFIGIESPDEASLKETKKLQNTRQDILSSVRHIYAHGIEILGGFIVGFDNDTLATFERQYQFITQSGIQAAMVGLLTAAPKTPLYDRLAKEGRIIPNASASDNTRLGTNVIPKQMTYEQLVDGYRELQCRLLHHKGIALRIRNKYRYLKRPLARYEYTLREQVRMLRTFLVRGLLPGGVTRLLHFVRSLPLRRPRLIPLVVRDWILGLSMRDYFDRRYAQTRVPMSARARARVRAIEHAFRRYVQQGSLEVSLEEVKDAAATLSISMKGWLDRRFFTKGARELERLLGETTSSITLRVEALHETQRRHLEHLLDRLARYGDRVHIAVREELRSLVQIDSSVFNLVLDS